MNTIGIDHNLNRERIRKGSFKFLKPFPSSSGNEAHR